jgi:putative flippase GtrA
LIRSSGVGAISTLVDLGSLTILIQLFSLSPSAANLPALLLGVASQFLGNKLFAFGDRAQGKALAVQGGQFALVEAGALLLNAIAFQLLVSQLHIPYLLSRLFASAGVYFGYSFPLWNRIFRQEHA